MPDENKIKIKLPNGAEFEADGPKAADLFAQFLEVVRSMKGSEAPDETGSPREPASTGQDGDFDVDPKTVKRIFQDRNGVVSLTAMPRTERSEADALLVVLLGYSILRNLHTVSAPQLMQSARQSGIQADRIDRILAPYGNYLTVGGFKKGKKYGLNNQGITRAKEVLKGIL